MTVFPLAWPSSIWRSARAASLRENVFPIAGLSWLLIAFTVIVLGGMGSVLGTLVGAFAVALAQEYGALVFGPQYQNLIVFGLLVIVLVIRPNGIFGRRLG